MLDVRPLLGILGSMSFSIPSRLPRHPRVVVFRQRWFVSICLLKRVSADSQLSQLSKRLHYQSKFNKRMRKESVWRFCRNALLSFYSVSKWRLGSSMIITFIKLGFWIIQWLNVQRSAKNRSFPILALFLLFINGSQILKGVVYFRCPYNSITL